MPKFKRKMSTELSTSASDDIGSSVVRAGGRTKKPKNIWDPSDYNNKKKDKLAEKGYEKPRTPTKTTSSSKQLSPMAIKSCFVCQKFKSSSNETRFKTCSICIGFRAHSLCLKKELRARRGVEWSVDEEYVCDYCVKCEVCHESRDIGSLFYCSGCHKSYHSACHVPKISLKTIMKNVWKCTECFKSDSDHLPAPKQPKNKIVTEKQTITTKSKINLLNTSPRTTQRPVNREIKFEVIEKEDDSDSKIEVDEEDELEDQIPRFVLPQMESEELQEPENLLKFEDDAQIPDVKDWSFQDVYNHFQKLFPKHAHIFQEQEIDGLSILLMKRSDILYGFQLKLGVALNMYRHIVMLQTRSMDPRLCWR